MAKLLNRYRGLIFNLLLIALSFVFMDAFRPFLQGHLEQQTERIWSMSILFIFVLEMPAMAIKGGSIAISLEEQNKASNKDAQNTLLALLVLGGLAKIALDTLFIQIALENLGLELSTGWLIAGVAVKNLLLLFFLFSPASGRPHFSVELLADACLLLIASMAYVFLQEAFLSPIDLDNIRLLALLLFLISLLFLLFYIPYRLPYVFEDWLQPHATWGRLGYILSYFVLVFLFLRPTFYQSSQLMEELRAAGQAKRLHFQSDYGRLRTEQLKEICSQTELQSLALRGLAIDYLSACWTELQALRYLDMRDNDLRKFYSLHEYPKLDTLLLANNNFSELNFMPSQPHSLKALDLAHNPLKYLPADMAPLSSLQWLRLDDCPIDSFSKAGLKGLTSLKELSLRRSVIDVLPPFAVSAGTLPQLQRLNYSTKALGFRIDSAALKQLSNLRVLDLHGQAVSEKQKQQLRRAFPKVELLLDSNDWSE